MSRDFSTLRARVNALIGNNPGVEPSLIVYPDSQATDNTGNQAGSLQNFLSDTSNYPANTFFYVYGEPTTSTDGTGILPGASSTVMGGDLLVKGTLFTDFLRTKTGVLVDFEGIAYIPPSGTNFLTSGPTTAANADKLLDVEIKTNKDAITTNTANIASISTLADLHETSIGLETDGTFVANASGNYIKTATTVRNEAFLIDQQVYTNTTDIALKASTADLSTLQTEVDAIETGAGLQSNGSYTANSSGNYITTATSLFDADNKLDSQIKVNADAIAAVGLGNIANVQTEVNSIEAAVGLDIDGTYLSHSGSNYIDAATTVKDALTKLDTQIKSSADLVALNATTASLNTLQTEVDAIETAAGFNADGTYSVHSGSNYLDAATSIKDSLSKLDTQLKTTQTDLDSAEAAITTLQSEMSSVETLAESKSSQIEVDAIETAIGLHTDGTYLAHDTSNYIDTATTVKDALTKLDTQLKTTQDEVDAEETIRLNAINSLTSEISSIENSLGLTLSGLRPDYANTNYIDNTDSHHTAIGKIDAAIITIQGGNAGQTLALQELKDSVGTDNDGELAAFAGTNFLDGIDVVKTALTTLDTSIGNRSIFNIDGINHANKADGKILQYDLASDKFVYVEPSTGPQGAEGRGISSVTENNNGTFTLNFSDGLNPFTTIDLTGPQGPQGNTGADGAAGEDGAAGAEGAPGAAGAAATIAVGTVTTGNAGTNVVVSNSGNANAAVFDFTIPKGAAGADGAAGEDGAAGAAGADAPTITDISVSGTTVTTTLSSGGPLSGTYSSSIGDLSDVDIASVAPTNNQVLKWDSSSSKFKPADDVNGGGGVDLSVTDNLTSVAGTATLDVQQLAAVTDSGGNEATLVGIIGSAEDADYSDGLFADFTPTTRIGHAIDKFNEVLKALAPSPAPDLSQFDVNTSSSSLSNILLSFGESNNQSAASPAYHTVLNTAGFTDLSDKIDVNESFPIISESNNYRRGVYTGTTTLEGDLNENVLEDAYSNGIVNYSANSFGEGDLGTLQLWLNGSSIHSIDLTAFVSGNDLNGNGSGFINMSAATSGKFSSDSTFSNFKHRQGQWRVHHSDQRNGWNYVQVKHVVGANEKVTGYAEWVNDNSSDEIVVTNKSLTLNKSGSKHISGIEYNTNVTATYSADIDNFYKYVYKAGNITFDESPASLASFNDFAIPAIDIAGGEDHTKQINLTKTTTLLLDNNRILNGTLQTGFNLSHPVKTDITSAGTNQTINGILVDNQSATSTNFLSNFDDEDYRLIDTTSYFMSGVEDNTYQWDSTESLAGADGGHNKGLLVYNSRLYSPKSSDLPNDGDFTNINSNPDYSAIGNDNRVWIRKFKNTTGNPISALLFNINKVNSNVEDSSSLNNSQINIQFKIPSKSGPPLNPQTNWLSVASDFDLAGYLNETHTSCGDSTYNGNINGNTITNKIAIFKEEVANNDYVLVKITASHEWSGYVDSFSVDFDNVVGAITSSPELSSIDSDQTGVLGKLSFGATNTVTDYTNYTSDINTQFNLDGNKSGIFNGSQDITGFLNSLVNQSGNNYPQYAFGGGEGNLGTLKLNVNGTDVHSIDLSSRPFLTGSQVNANGSGFTDLVEPSPSRDSNNRTNYSKLWRTSKFIVDTSDQRLGYNFAKVIHVTANGDEESNIIEWINDSNTDNPDFTNSGASTYLIDSTQITSTETNDLSGISYYKKVTNVPYEIKIKNMYKNIYSSESDAVTVADANNKVKIKSLLLTGINNASITNSGSHTLPGDSNSGSKELPAITGAADNTDTLKVNSIFEINYTKSIPDIASGTPYTGMNDITVNTTVKHPLRAAGGKTTSGVNEQITSNKFLQFEVSDSAQSVIEETFSNETKRLPDDVVYTTQANASGASWDSSAALNNGLLMYDGNLVYPKGDFRDVNESGSIYAPSGNPNYSSMTGTKYFYRIFQNNTAGSKTGFTLQLQGDGSVLVDPSSAFSATNIKIAVKIPTTGSSQTTGYLNIAKDFETGQYDDDDGSLSGSLTATISSGSVVSNTVTFGQKFLQPNEYFVMRIEADQNWSGYLSNIAVVWS